MKRYSVGTLGTFESETGEWVPADVAAEMYEALKDVAEALRNYAQDRGPIGTKVRAAIAKAEGRSL